MSARGFLPTVIFDSGLAERPWATKLRKGVHTMIRANNFPPGKFLFRTIVSKAIAVRTAISIAIISCSRFTPLDQVNIFMHRYAPAFQARAR
jgi:hypothetical protein